MKFGDIHVNVLTDDKPPKAISDAKVTLLRVIADNRTRTYHVTEIVNINGNPLLQANDVISGSPAYTFKDIPYYPDDDSRGYWAMMEKDGNMRIVPVTIGEVSGAYYDNSWDKVPKNLTGNTIYGFIAHYDAATDKTQPVSGANVSLYRCTGYDRTGKNTNRELVSTFNNAQIYIENESTGFFRFDGIQPGYYNLTANKGGLTDSMVVNFTGGDVSKYQVYYLNIQ